MDIDPYRLAYSVLHCNWIKFGIPQEDIPPPKTEKVDSLDPIIPGFATAVVLFQIASREDLKSFLDKEFLTAHNFNYVYARFLNIMRNGQPIDAIVIDWPNDEDVSQDTIEECFSEDSLEADLPKDIKREKLPSVAMKEELLVDIVKEVSTVSEGVTVDIVKEGLLEDAMKEDLPEDAMKEDLPEDAMKEDLPEDAMKEELPQNAMKEDFLEDAEKKALLEDALKEELPQNAMKEELLEDGMKEELPQIDIDLLKDAMREDLPEIYKKEGILEDVKKGPTENIVLYEDIPGLMAYSLAVCTEFVLYERKKENHKEYMKFMPEMWKKYFDKNLKPLCKKARYTQEHLENYSKSMKCLEKFLNKFISENKNEYNDIADRFYGYTENHVATVSPEHSQLITEVRNLSKGMPFLKIKEKFAALKEICNTSLKT